MAMSGVVWNQNHPPSHYHPVTATASFDFIEFRFQQLSFLLNIYLKSCLSVGPLLKLCELLHTESFIDLRLK